MALLVQMQTSQLLPQWEIPTYDGDPPQLIYESLSVWRQRRTEKEMSVLPGAEKGQPRGSCLHMTSVVKQRLEEHFRDEFRITAAYTEKVTRWPIIIQNTDFQFMSAAV